MKNHSLFARCIRLLALGLLPALVVSCATSSSDSSDNQTATTDNQTDNTTDNVTVPVDLTSPALGSLVPADGTSGRAIEENLVLTFNEALLDSTVTVSDNATCSGSLRLSADNFSSCVVGALSNTDNITYTFNPTDNLSYSTTYLVRVGTEITDLAGNSLDKQYDTSFTTADPPPTLSETIGTELRSALTASVSSAVSRNARIYVTATRSTTLTAAQIDAIVDAALAGVSDSGSADLSTILPEMLSGAMGGIGGLTLSGDSATLDVLHVSFSALQKSMNGKTSYLSDSAGTIAGTLVGKALEKMSTLNLAPASLDEALGDVVDASVSNLDDAGVGNSDLNTVVSGIATTAVNGAGSIFSSTTLGTGLEALAQNLIGALDDAGVSSSSLSATTASVTTTLVGALGDIAATSDGTTMTAATRETLVGTVTASSIKGLNGLSGADRSALAAQISGGAVQGVGVLAKAGKADTGSAISSLATSSATALGSLTGIDSTELTTISLAVQGSIEGEIDVLATDTALSIDADTLKNTTASGLQAGVNASGVTGADPNSIAAPGTKGGTTADTVAPSLTVVSSVSSPTNSPALTIHSNESAALSFAGNCSSTTTTLTTSDNISISLVNSGGTAYSNGDTVSDCVITATDNATNSTTVSVDTFTVDTAAPGYAFGSVTSLTNDSTPSFTIYSDEAATVSASGSYTLDNSSLAAATKTSFTLGTLSDGTYSDVTITLTDAAGNTASKTLSSFTVDANPPAASSVTVYNLQQGHSDNTSDASVFLMFNASDANSSLGLQYFITENATYAPSSSDFSSTLVTGYGFQSDNVTDNVTGDSLITDNVTYEISNPPQDNGSATLYVWLIDAAGNISDNVSDSIVIVDNDSTLPTLSNFSIYGVTSDNDSTTVDNATFTNNQSFSFQASFLDTGIGATHYFVSENASLSSADNASFTWTAITLASGSRDNGSFVGTGNFDNTSIDNKTVFLWIKDGSGNVVAASENDTIMLDNAGPVFSSAISVRKEPNTYGTDNVTEVGGDNYTRNQTIVLNSLSATDIGPSCCLNDIFGLYLSETNTAPDTDNSSGIWRNEDNLTYTFSSSSSGTKTIYAWLLDNATNLSSSSSVTLVYDGQGPIHSGTTRAILDNTSDNGSHVTIDFGSIPGDTNEVTSQHAPVYAYFIADNVTLAATNDNITADLNGWDNLSSTTTKIDFSNSESLLYEIPGTIGIGHTFTIYVWFKDAAQNVLTDNLTLQVGKYFTK